MLAEGLSLAEAYRAVVEQTRETFAPTVPACTT
jgi:hypothetical protein